MDLDVHQAMLNSYYSIVRDYDPILLIKNGKGFFMHNPAEEIERKDLEDLLLYFEDEEDYDKCQDIRDYINRKWSLENTKRK